MKYLFLSAAAALTFAAILLQHDLSRDRGEVPVLYWVTDPNPARQEQIRLFRVWLAAKGLPDVDVRLDTSNNDEMKKVVQGVSGIAGDVMDVWTGSSLRYYQQLGLVSDVTDDGVRLGFDVSQTYPSVLPEITIDGAGGKPRQYMFPCNVVPTLYFVNLEVLERVGIERPPERWTVDEFEAMGKRFVAAANSRGRRDTFWADGVDRSVLYRSLGASELNETCTASAFADERVVRTLRTIYRWTYADHLLPSNADHQSFSAESGYGGASPQLFNAGRYALMSGGRHAFIQFRVFDQSREAEGRPRMKLAVVEPPYFRAGLPNIPVGTRAAAVYSGSSRRESALLFLAYLASDDYSRQIVLDADSLPPLPRFTSTEAFLRPPGHENEWGLHEVFARATEQIAIGGSYSPFVLMRQVERETNRAADEVMNNRLSPEAAVRQAADRIDAAIQRTLRENPSLRQSYDERVALQSRIEAYRAQGHRVPRAWLKNPVHLAYYQLKGWCE